MLVVVYPVNVDSCPVLFLASLSVKIASLFNREAFPIDREGVDGDREAYLIDREGVDSDREAFPLTGPVVARKSEKEEVIEL